MDRSTTLTVIGTPDCAFWRLGPGETGGELVTLGVVAKGSEQGTMRINYNLHVLEYVAAKKS